MFDNEKFWAQTEKVLPLPYESLSNHLRVWYHHFSVLCLDVTYNNKTKKRTRVCPENQYLSCHQCPSQTRTARSAAEEVYLYSIIFKSYISPPNVGFSIRKPRTAATLAVPECSRIPLLVKYKGPTPPDMGRAAHTRVR